MYKMKMSVSHTVCSFNEMIWLTVILSFLFGDRFFSLTILLILILNPESLIHFPTWNFSHLTMTGDEREQLLMFCVAENVIQLFSVVSYVNLIGSTFALPLQLQLWCQWRCLVLNWILHFSDLTEYLEIAEYSSLLSSAKTAVMKTVMVPVQGKNTPHFFFLFCFN